MKLVAIKILIVAQVVQKKSQIATKADCDSNYYYNILFLFKFS